MLYDSDADSVTLQSNTRTDEYSATADPLRLLSRIVSAIRDVVPAKFALGIKLNAADYARGTAEAEETVLQHVRSIASWANVDFIEVSGGDYRYPGVYSVLFSLSLLTSGRVHGRQLGVEASSYLFPLLFIRTL